MYKIIGTDGKEYGPATADQIRQWIRENRVERQSPVFISGTTDWTFVGLLPEFANDFPGSVPPTIAPSKPGTFANSPFLSCSMAKTGLIFGILSITLVCCCGGLPFNLLGLIFSVIALVQINENPQRYGGRDMAIIGLILSTIGIIVLMLELVVR